MGRIIGISFMVLAVFALISQIGLHTLMMGGASAGGAISGLSSGIAMGLELFAFGLIYWLIGKAVPNSVSTAFGWIHLVFAVCNQILSASALWAQIQYMDGGAGFDIATVGLLFGAATIAFVFGMICHISAIIAAISYAVPSEPADAFG